MWRARAAGVRNLPPSRRQVGRRFAAARRHALESRRARDPAREVPYARYLLDVERDMAVLEGRIEVLTLNVAVIELAFEQGAAHAHEVLPRIEEGPEDEDGLESVAATFRAVLKGTEGRRKAGALVAVGLVLPRKIDSPHAHVEHLLAGLPLHRGDNI